MNELYYFRNKSISQLTDLKDITRFYFFKEKLKDVEKEMMEKGAFIHLLRDHKMVVNCDDSVLEKKTLDLIHNSR